MRLSVAIVLVVGLGLPFAPHALADPAADRTAGIAALGAGELPDAVRLLRRAAEGGDVVAMTRLAEILDAAEEDAEARALFRTAAAAGNAAAIYGLSRMTATGEGGPRDAPEARRLLERAADLGEPRAMVAIAQAYRRGDLGFPVDATAADDWDRRSGQSTRPPTRAAADTGRKR